MGGYIVDGICVCITEFIMFTCLPATVHTTQVYVSLRYMYIYVLCRYVGSYVDMYCVIHCPVQDTQWGNTAITSYTSEVKGWRLRVGG